MVLCPKSHRKNTPESTQFCLMLLLSQPNSIWKRPCAWFPKGYQRVEKVLDYTDRAGSTHAVCPGDAEDPGEDGAGV